MASFNELLDMAMGADTWEKGVAKVGDFIKVFPRGMAQDVADTAWEHRTICTYRKDSGNETDTERFERKYTKEIWEQAIARTAWLDYQIPPSKPWEKKSY